jgi:HSP20 family protein
MIGSSWMPQLWRDQREGEEPLQALRRQFDEFFDEMMQGFRAPSVASMQRPMAPRVDVSENDNEIMVSAELPGVEQKDIDVSLRGRQLMVKGEKRMEGKEGKEGKGRTYHRVERSFGPFQRIVAIPFDADPASVSATFRDGVLNVIVPKPADMKAKITKISIKRPT